MTFHPIAADRRAADRRPAVARTEGLFGRMLRLWVEHHQRMMDLGIRPH